MATKENGCIKFFVRFIEAIGIILVIFVVVALYISNKEEKDKIAQMTPDQKKEYLLQKAEQEAKRESDRLQEKAEIEKAKQKKIDDELAKRKAFAEKWSRMPEKEQMAYCDKLLQQDLTKWESEVKHKAVDNIREKLNNPDSFKLVECTSCFVGYGRINVLVTFRGTNAFGGVVTNQKSIGYDFVYNPLTDKIECKKATFLD
jgi:hypothetical protein